MHIIFFKLIQAPHRQKKEKTEHLVSEKLILFVLFTLMCYVFLTKNLTIRIINFQ